MEWKFCNEVKIYESKLEFDFQDEKLMKKHEEDQI